MSELIQNIFYATQPLCLKRGLVITAGVPSSARGIRVNFEKYKSTVDVSITTYQILQPIVFDSLLLIMGGEIISGFVM